MQAAARLKPGVTIDQARAELANLMEGLKQNYPATHSREHGVYATALKDYVVDANAQRALWVLFGAVVLVLLIACANVANLSLAQAAVRERELAVRTALGASRFALVRLLLSESVLLLAGGIVAGWLLAQWLLATVLKFSPEQVRHMGEIKLDAGVLVFTLALSVLTGLIFGLAPVLSATKVDLNVSLKDGARAVSGSRRQHRLRGALIVLEVALALILLTGSGLLLKSFVNLRTVELGFNPDRLLTMSLRLPFNDYKEPERRVNYFQQTLGNLQRLPGVEAAGICFSLPMTGRWCYRSRLDRRPAGPAQRRRAGIARWQRVSRLLQSDGHSVPPWPRVQRGGSLAGAAGHYRQRGVFTTLLSLAKIRLANASRWVLRVRRIRRSSESSLTTFSQASII